MKAKLKMTSSFEEAYSNIVHFVDAIGYITIGHDDDSPLTSFIQAKTHTRRWTKLCKI